MSEEDYRKYEKLDDLFKFLEDIIPDDSDAEDVKPKLRGQKRWVSATLQLLSPFLMHGSYAGVRGALRLVQGKWRRTSAREARDLGEIAFTPSAEIRVR
jgi:condensin complex subunit 3